MSGKFYSIERAVVDGKDNAKMLEHALHEIFTKVRFNYLEDYIRSDKFKSNYRPIDTNYACLLEYNELMDKLSCIQKTDRHGTITIKDMFTTQTLLTEVLQEFIGNESAYDDENDIVYFDHDLIVVDPDVDESVIECHRETREIFDNFASIDFSAIDIPLPVMGVTDISNSSDAISANLSKRR